MIDKLHYFTKEEGYEDTYLSRDRLSMFCKKGSYFDKFFSACYPLDKKTFSLKKVRKKARIIKTLNWEIKHLYWEKVNKNCSFPMNAIKYALRIFGEKARFRFPKKNNPICIDSEDSEYCYFIAPNNINPVISAKWEENKCWFGSKCFNKITGFLCPKKARR